MPPRTLVSTLFHHRTPFALHGIPPRLPRLLLLLPPAPIGSAVRYYAAIRQPMDEEIKPLQGTYIDHTGTFHGLVSAYDILRTMDRSIFHLVHINPQVQATEENPTPAIFKQVTKEHIQEQLLRQYKEKKEKRGTAKDPAKVSKDVEMSWAISQHDLNHRFKKIEEFMSKGYKVSVMLGTKKGMQKQPLSVMHALVDQVRAFMDKHGRETLQPMGQIGRKYQIFYESVPGGSVREVSRGTALQDIERESGDVGGVRENEDAGHAQGGQEGVEYAQEYAQGGQEGVEYAQEYAQGKQEDVAYAQDHAPEQEKREY